VFFGNGAILEIGYPINELSFRFRVELMIKTSSGRKVLINYRTGNCPPHPTKAIKKPDCNKAGSPAIFIEL